MWALKRLFCSERPVFLSIGIGSSWGIHGERSFDVLWLDIRHEGRGNRRTVRVPQWFAGTATEGSLRQESQVLAHHMYHNWYFTGENHHCLLSQEVRHGYSATVYIMPILYLART